MSTGTIDYVDITPEKINTEHIIDKVTAPDCGAASIFLGRYTQTRITIIIFLIIYFKAILIQEINIYGTLLYYIAHFTS